MLPAHKIPERMQRLAWFGPYSYYHVLICDTRYNGGRIVEHYFGLGKMIRCMAARSALAVTGSLDFS